MDVRDVSQVQSTVSTTTASRPAVEGLSKYIRMFETLRMGVAKANRELLRAALDVVEQELAEAEAHQNGSFVKASASGPRPVAAASPGKSGLPTASPTERFRGVPPIREASVTELHVKAEE